MRMLNRLLLLLGLCIPALVAVVTVSAQSYQVHTYTENDGLPSSTVYDMAQDASGRMWFATRGGVASYNGINWSVYSVAEGLPGADVLKIETDHEDRIWALNEIAATVGFSHLIVSYLNDQTWQSLPPITVPRKFTLRADLVILQDEESIPAVSVRESGVFLWEGGRWQQYAQEKGIDTPVNAIVAIEDRLYVATDAGLAVIHKNEVDTTVRTDMRTPASAIISMALEQDVPGTSEEPILWLQGWNWIGTYHQGRFTLIEDQVPLTSGLMPIRIQPDGIGGVFYGNLDGVYTTDRPNQVPQFIGKANGLIADGVTAFLRDREYNLWIAGLRGVSKIYDRRFLTYHKEHGLLDDEVTAITNTDSDVVILGHDEGVTFVEDGRLRTMAIRTTRVMDLHRDPAGDIWIACSDRGLAHMNREGKIVRWYDQADGLDLLLSSILVDRAGQLWVGTYQHLYRLENGRFNQVTVGSDRSLTVRRVVEGPSGTIYLATVREGLYVYKDETWVQYKHPSDRMADNQYSVLEDRTGRVWVGTVSGIYTIDGDSLAKADLNGMHMDRPIYGILEDGEDRLWLGTDNGIFRWDGQSLDSFSVREGLAGSEINRAAMALDTEGRIWVGTNRGLSIYNEKLARPVTPAALVGLISMDVTGNRIPLMESQSLSYNNNSPVFHFQAVSFIDEHNIRYRYQLEGFDKDWTPAVRMSVPQIRYTNLPSGAYRFRLQAQNAAGVWSPEVSSAEIVVAPPFWRSWWSYALYVLALSIGIMGSIRYHHRELERKHALQEREELTEARDAAEAANRAKSLFLANMSHEIRTPLNAILGYAQILQRHPELPVDVRGPIQTIESSGNHLLELINEVLDLSKIEAGRLERQDVDFDLRGLMESIGEMFRMRCEQKGLAWRLDSERLPEGPLHVHGDEQKIRQILINLLANAAKFTDGGEVMLRIAEATNQDSPNHEDDSAPPHYLFEVIDTGVGIAEEDRTRILTPFQQGSAARATEGTGLGLTIAHRMVHLLDGTIDFDSQAGKGSRFWFTLPLPPAEGEVVLPADIESAPVKRLAEGYTVKALVVDDVLENRDVLYQLLNDIGCEVQLAVNGLEALEAVRTERPDIVLMDIRMPVMDGLEAARRIIKEYGSGSIKLVAVTASAFAHNRQEYLNAGFDAFLSKPFKMVEIYNCIITLLGVEYVYDTGEDTPTGLAPVNMPDDMLSSLKEAAEYGDVTALDAAFDRLEVLGEDEHRLADHLRQLNENLEMGTILEILEEMTQYK